MRSLDPAPRSLLDDQGHPRFGSYRGGLPLVDLRPVARGGLYDLTHRKRWIYVAIASDDLRLCGVVIDFDPVTGRARSINRITRKGVGSNHQP